MIWLIRFLKGSEMWGDYQSGAGTQAEPQAQKGQTASNRILHLPCKRQRYQVLYCTSDLATNVTELLIFGLIGLASTISCTSTTPAPPARTSTTARCSPASSWRPDPTSSSPPPSKPTPHQGSWSGSTRRENSLSNLSSNKHNQYRNKNTKCMYSYLCFPTSKLYFFPLTVFVEAVWFRGCFSSLSSV